MKLVLLLVEVVFILKILTNVECQFMPPPMGGMQFPPLPPQMPMHMPGMPMPGMPMPGIPMPGMPMPMPMPMSFMGQQKLPMVVMPYHNKNQDKLQNKKSKKGKKDKRRKRKKKKFIKISSSSSSSSSSECSSGDSSADCGFRKSNNNLRRNGRARSRSHKKRGQVLTPVISYVTKDGYVVYQKKIKKEKAKDWLEMSNSSPNRQPADAYQPPSSSEEMLRTIIRKQMDKVRSQAKRDKMRDDN